MPTPTTLPHSHTRVTGLVDSRAASTQDYLQFGLRFGIQASALTGFADTDLIGNILDVGGSGVVAISGTNRIPYRTAQINGLPAFSFAGASYIQMPNVFSTLTAAHLFAVIRITADPPPSLAKSGLHRLDNITNGDQTLYPYYADSTVYEGWGSTARKAVGNPTPSLASWRLYEISSAAGAYTVWLDGTQIFTTATNTVAFATSGLYVGASYAIGQFLDGMIAEYLVYDHALSSGERTVVKAGIATKYALTIA